MKEPFKLISGGRMEAMCRTRPHFNFVHIKARRGGASAGMLRWPPSELASVGPCLETRDGYPTLNATTGACPRGAVFFGGSAGTVNTAPPRQARVVASSSCRFCLVSKHSPTGTSPAHGLDPCSAIGIGPDAADLSGSAHCNTFHRQDACATLQSLFNPRVAQASLPVIRPGLHSCTSCEAGSELGAEYRGLAGTPVFLRLLQESPQPVEALLPTPLQGAYSYSAHFRWLRRKRLYHRLISQTPSGSAEREPYSERSWPAAGMLQEEPAPEEPRKLAGGQAALRRHHRNRAERKNMRPGGAPERSLPDSHLIPAATGHRWS